MYEVLPKDKRDLFSFRNRKGFSNNPYQGYYLGLIIFGYFIGKV